MTRMCSIPPPAGDEPAGVLPRRSAPPGEVTAMTASCDSWFYNNQLDIPTVVFGPGSLRFAHSNEEQIRLGRNQRRQRRFWSAISSQEWCGVTTY